MSKLLVIDDEPNVLYSLENALQSSTLSVLTATTARQGLRLASRMRPDMAMIDVQLPDMSGLDARFHSGHRRPTARYHDDRVTTTETAIEATKRGAYDYLIKPVDLKQLRGVINRALDRGRSPNRRRNPNVEQLTMPVETIVGRSPAMHDVYKAIGRVAAHRRQRLDPG